MELLIFWKSVWKGANRSEAPPVPEKTEGGLETGLANLWSRKRITKKAYAGRGQETKWEMSIIILMLPMLLRMGYQALDSMTVTQFIRPQV